MYPEICRIRKKCSFRSLLNANLVAKIPKILNLGSRRHFSENLKFARRHWNWLYRVDVSYMCRRQWVFLYVYFTVLIPRGVYVSPRSRILIWHFHCTTKYCFYTLNCWNKYYWRKIVMKNPKYSRGMSTRCR